MSNFRFLKLPTAELLSFLLISRLGIQFLQNNPNSASEKVESYSINAN